MSTFNGQFDGIPCVSADRFDGDNRKSSVFFLSHCHTDHMIGLDHRDGLPGPLYLSQISALIAKRLFPNPLIWDRSVVLEIGQPTVISYTANSEEDLPPRRLTVTAIPAGHCPGSVMFMLELDDRRILYTGDFRLSATNLARLKIFKTGPRIDVAHVDSTFFTRSYMHFPHQNESAKVVGQLITEWLQLNPAHQVALQLSARYGYEYLFIHLHTNLGVSVHVNDIEAEKYRYIPEMDQCISKQRTGTRVHACFNAGRKMSGRSKREIPCDSSVAEKHIRVIKPSAMVWTGWTSGEPIHRKEGEQFYRVCYSNHASWSELRDMLQYLRPVDVRLNVLPTDATNRMKMLKELQTIQSEYQDEKITTQLISNNLLCTTAFDLTKLSRGKHINVAAEDSDDEAPVEIRILKRRKQSM